MKTDFQMQRAQTMTRDFRCSYSDLCFRRFSFAIGQFIEDVFQTFARGRFSYIRLVSQSRHMLQSHAESMYQYLVKSRRTLSTPFQCS